VIRAVGAIRSAMASRSCSSTRPSKAPLLSKRTDRLPVGARLLRGAARPLTWLTVALTLCAAAPLAVRPVQAQVWAPTAGYTPLDCPDGEAELTAALVPNDPLYEQYQWNLKQIQLPDTWDLTIGSPDIIIAVLDTGIALSHPDLVNKLVPGYDFVNNDDVPDDDHGNGTHVAGIAAAETNNTVGIAGVGWQARLMPVKVLDATAGGDTSQAALGVRWAVDHGARVLNLGLAGPTPSSALQDAIDYARRRGAVVVAPVASSGTADISYPAAIPGVIAVAATDRSDRRLAASNTGDYISVAAPGEQVASTFRFTGGSAGYAVASTTAQAAAHVSGLAALILAINPALQPDEVRALIEVSADDVGPRGRDLETGAGRINAARAVLYAAPWNFNARGAGSYSAILTPSNRVNFPLIMKETNGWSTSFTVQNTTEGPATLTVDLYDEEGRLAHSFPSNLPAHGSITYEPARIPVLPRGFIGSAVVRSDAALSGVVNEDRPDRDRLTYEGFSAGTSVAWAPLLMRHYHGWNTGIQIQNLGAGPATARVTYTTRSASEPLAVSTFTIAPSASRTLYQPLDDRIPPDWVGSAVIESLDGQPLAAIVNQVNVTGPGMSYVGISRPSPRIFAPLLFKNAGGWSTGLQVQNASLLAANLEASFFGNSGDGGPWSETVAAAPGASATFYQPASAQLPEGFVGAGTVTADAGQPLAGVVNEVRTGTTMATAYDVIDRGASTIYIPLAYRGFAGWNSGIQVQNVGISTTTATVTFFGQNGTTAATVQTPIEAGESETYYLPTIGPLRSGFVGNAIATSSSEPIAAIVNHVK
jgi:Subtilase family